MQGGNELKFALAILKILGQNATISENIVMQACALCMKKKEVRHYE